MAAKWAEKNYARGTVDRIYCYKLFPEAHMPVKGSDLAACFDLKASMRDGDEIKFYNKQNVKTVRKVVDQKITMYHGDRMLIPTGLVFDLSTDTSLRIHPRSGLSSKNGINIANCEGVVDSDYVEQTFVLLLNISNIPFEVSDGMRIAQAEIVPVVDVDIKEISMRPEQKTSRNGGFGSTGL
jgi:dUTP pyrophosphatase